EIQPAWHCSGFDGRFVAARRACAAEAGKCLLSRKWAGDSHGSFASAGLAAAEMAIFPFKLYAHRAWPKQPWIAFPQSETKRPRISLYTKEVAAHPIGGFASKRKEVAEDFVWPQALICAKVFPFNRLRDPWMRRESEYATFPMGVGFGRY